MKTTAFLRKNPAVFARQKARSVQARASFASAWNKDLLGDWASSWLDALRGKFLVPDLISAITVAAVALPLNIALAVACGLPPHSGLIAGAIGGGIAAIFGGI